MPETPGKPRDAVDSTDHHVNLHVVAVVKAYEGHVVNMIRKEGSEERCNYNSTGIIGSNDSQAKDKKGEEHCGEGTEVVHHFGEDGVPSVKYCRPEPGINGC